MNLELDFIDYPTAWAIVKENELWHDPRCSYLHTKGALLCDCDAVPTKWAELKGLPLTDERVTRYLSSPTPETEQR